MIPLICSNLVKNLKLFKPFRHVRHLEKEVNHWKLKRMTCLVSCGVAEYLCVRVSRYLAFYLSVIQLIFTKF